jgi:hypothetical protein
MWCMWRGTLLRKAITRRERYKVAQEPPRIPQDALRDATVELANLRRRLPGAKVGKVLEVLGTIEYLWSNQEPTQFPFNTLLPELEATKFEINLSFEGDLDQVVSQGSAVFDRVVNLDHKITIYQEVMYTNPLYRGLENRLQHLERVLPPRNFAFEDLLNDLKPEFDPSIRRELEALLQHFRDQNYRLVLIGCTTAEELLVLKYKNLLVRLNITVAANSTGQTLAQIRSKFDSEKDPEGLSLKKGARLEQLILSMFDCLHFLRNLGTHESGVHEERLPQWQLERRAALKSCESARLVVLLALQIAVELQAMEAQGSGK